MWSSTVPIGQGGNFIYCQPVISNLLSPEKSEIKIKISAVWEVPVLCYPAIIDSNTLPDHCLLFLPFCHIFALYCLMISVCFELGILKNRETFFVIGLVIKLLCRNAKSIFAVFSFPIVRSLTSDHEKQWMWRVVYEHNSYSLHSSCTWDYSVMGWLH